VALVEAREASEVDKAVLEVDKVALEAVKEVVVLQGTQETQELI
jgi:hypothetical protein